jgi:hypothetical protein
VSLEIANLVARLTVELEGVNDSVNLIRQYTAQAAEAGKISEELAHQVEGLSLAVQEQTATLGKQREAVAAQQEVFRQMGMSVDQAREKVRRWREETEWARTVVDAMLNSGQTPPARLILQAEGKGPGAAEIAALTKALDEQDKLDRQVARSQHQLAGTSNRLARAFGLVRVQAEGAAGGLRSKLRALLAINNGSILTASGVASLVGRLTGLGLIATTLIVGFRKLFRTWREGAAAVDAFTRADDGLAKMVLHFQAMGERRHVQDDRPTGRHPYPPSEHRGHRPYRRGHAGA